jgi:hypothetical protein
MEPDAKPGALAALVWMALMVATPRVAEAAEPGAFYATAALGAARWDGSLEGECVGNYDGLHPDLPFGHYACTEGFIDRNAIAVRVGAGWQLNTWIAAELAYVNLGRADVRRTAGFSGLLPDGSFTLPANYRVTGRYQVQGLEVSALASWPVTREFAVTGRAGALLYHATYEEHGIASHGRTWSWRPGSTTGVAPLAGVGVRYAPDPRLAFGVEWVHVHDAGRTYGGYRDASGVGKADIDTLFVGASFSFP